MPQDPKTCQHTNVMKHDQKPIDYHTGIPMDGWKQYCKVCGAHRDSDDAPWIPGELVVTEPLKPEVQS